MKVGGSIGYTSGMLYKRHKLSTYTPGSKYARFGRLGLMNQRNMTSMNREAAAGYSSSFSFAGIRAFEAKQVESEGLSEIAANQTLERVKAQMNALANSASSFSLANGGNGGTTGTSVDETA